MLFNILVCEDELNIRNLINEYLKKENYHVFLAKNGEEALDVLASNHIDLLITDIMMPVMDGYELASEMKEYEYNIPILMLTAKETLDDKKKGFNLGIDDYMVKPIEFEEMLLRVSALLRRTNNVNEKCLTIGSTILNYNDFTINDVLFPKKEFQMIFKLLSQPNHIFTRGQIMDEIWGLDSESDERTIDVHIRKIREKFENNTDFEIVTVKGLGYKGVIK